MSNVFDFVNAVSISKQDILAEGTHSAKDYIPFITNRAMSNFIDTALYANELNQRPEIDNDQQFYFYFHSIKKARRYSGKWPKTVRGEDLEAIKTFYKLNNQKAIVALSLLSPEQIDDIKKRVQHGGEPGGKD